jgi:hypothetical protein
MSNEVDAHNLAAPDESLHDMLKCMRLRIQTLKLDLSGLNVVTEAATAAYSCTAVIAALAGAKKVHAVARRTQKYGSAAKAVAETLSLARLAGVEDLIVPLEQLDRQALAKCDILTNSGHIRPISSEIIDCLPSGAVIALMFEAWEFRREDLDLDACWTRGVRVAAVNERHMDVAVFPFLGPLCVRQLGDAGMPVRNRRVAVFCDNPFAPFIKVGLEEEGASVEVFDGPAALTSNSWDAVVFALHPNTQPAAAEFFQALAEVAPHAQITQFWGDVDRKAADRFGFRVCPQQEPPKGHMGILLDVLGHEPIVRLQAGGLRAAELVIRGIELSAKSIAQLL